jgi:hypothetical protein
VAPREEHINETLNGEFSVAAVLHAVNRAAFYDCRRLMICSSPCSFFGMSNLLVLRGPRPPTDAICRH